MQAAYAAEYRRLWDEHWWWRSRRRFVCRLLAQLGLPGEGQVLDIGCGDALFFDDLAQYGHVHGIEPDRNLLKDANPHRERITVAPFGPGFDTDQRYGLITMLDVLEHIEDDRGTLDTVHGMLRPGGAVVLTVPAFRWLWSMHDVANRHFRRYTRKELAGKLADAGLAVQRCGYTFGWTVAAMLARRALLPAKQAPDDADEDAYRVTPPPAPINEALYLLTRAEQTIARALPMPMGSSVFAVARRPH